MAEHGPEQRACARPLCHGTARVPAQGHAIGEPARGTILSSIWPYLFGPLPRALMCPTMAANDDDHVIFLSGWSYTETTGRWTEGPLAMLAIQRAPERRGSFLRLEGLTIHAEPHKPQVIDVYSGWRRLARLSWKAGAPGTDVSFPVTHVIPLPPALFEREVLTVLFHIRSPIAPADLSPSPDQRRLGLYLRDIRTISLCVRDAAAAALDLCHGSSDRDCALERLVNTGFRGMLDRRP